MKQTEFLSSLPFKFVDFRSNLLATASKDIVSAHQSHGADLNNATIWCESHAYAHALRKSLLAAARDMQTPSILLPTIITLRDWLWQRYPADLPLINEANKQLLLMEAIRQFPTLFNTNNAWPVTKELVGLFNECTLAQVPLDAGVDKICDMLTQSYASPFADLHNISRESEIIYQLWQAYNLQINARNWIDPVQHYCDCLRQASNIKVEQSFYVVGKHRFTTLEENFYANISNTHPLTIYYPHVPAQQYAANHHPHAKFYDQNQTQGNTSNERMLALNIVYDSSTHAFERISTTKNTFKKNPYSSWLNIFTTHSIENHVNAICLQTKKWLLEQHFPIGIVSSDRLLTRRIRAVLEDAGITANDMGGWALSTTSAATAIEILLDAIETNFNKDHLFDLLSNPFLADNYQDSSYVDQVNHIRHQLKKNRAVMRGGISPYIEFVSAQNSESDTAIDLLKVLKDIQTNSKALLSRSYENEIELNNFSTQLQHLLEQLKILSSLREDDAGKQILNALEASLRAIHGNNIKLSWTECRQWLRDLFEHNYFVPNQIDPRVTLCGFDHLDHSEFTAVIVAGVEQTRLHNTASNRTFFNEKVRKELGLQTTSENEAINYIRFRQLLEQSEHVLLSAETENHGEAQEISAWVKMIELFSQEAFNESLETPILSYLLSEQQQLKNINRDSNITTSSRPQPATPEKFIPATISATQYQSLIDCPYQYFSKYILDIKSMDLSDDLDASEFGRLVHQCLHDFHFNQSDVARYRDIDFALDTRDTLISELTKTSTETFMRTSFPDAIKQGWLQRWLNNIPSYIDWAIARSEIWQPQQGEIGLNETLCAGTELQGQVDRLDTNGDGLALIDFKTGAIPTQKSVVQGETVQLPFYTLLSNDIVQAEYLELGNQNGVKAKVSLSEQDLAELKTRHQARLLQLVNDLKHNAPLTALGNERVCKYCDYQGFCRKAHWSANANNNEI